MATLVVTTCTKLYTRCFCKLFFSRSLISKTKNRQLHATAQNRDLMEFFDDKENWGQSEVKTGRSWKIEELRIKSNTDLHKLWYVLLKERNMLMTMQAEYERLYEAFPNPERIDKCEKSMDNIESVIGERDRAYNLLETGSTGEPERTFRLNTFAQPHYKEVQEFLIPEWMNTKYKRHYRPSPEAREFQQLWGERYQRQLARAKGYERRRRQRMAKHQPDVDVWNVELPKSDFRD